MLRICIFVLQAHWPAQSKMCRHSSSDKCK